MTEEAVRQGHLHWIESGFLRIPADPTLAIDIYASDTAPKLDVMQEKVGGLIEIVRVNFNGRVEQMVVNEEGLLRGLPLNWRASCVYAAGPILLRGQMPRNPIVGDVLLMIRLEIE